MDEGDKEIIALLTKIQATGGGSGAGCMGNASTSDVALGMTFSNSNGKNLIGTNTDNATVPDNAPFAPAQAFVDNITIFSNPRVEYANSSTLAFTGITTVELSADPNIPDVGKGDSIIFESAQSLDDKFGGSLATFTFDFSACALLVDSINGLFAAFVTGNFFAAVDPTKWTFNFGGLCAAPTGQGLTDKATIIGLGYHLTTN